jgi:hypothetical protein
MVRHEAVRDYFDVRLPCKKQKLRTRVHSRREFSKVVPPFKCAHREEHAVGADVEGIGEAWRAAMKHAPWKASFDPARLKPSRYEMVAQLALRDDFAQLALHSYPAQSLQPRAIS